MRHLRPFVFAVAAVFGASFVGAQCQSATPLTRTCAGSTVQNVTFFAESGCGGSGNIKINVPTADQCALALVEANGIGLPGTGTFSAAAGGTSYDLLQGNWNLQNPTNGMLGDNAGLQCTSGTPVGSGELNLTCQITMCGYVGEDLEPTCTNGGTCYVLLTQISNDAGLTGPSPDASTFDASVDGGADATTAHDAGSKG